MPIITKEVNIAADFSGLKRNSFDECVRFIVKDCQEAIVEPNLPWRNLVETDRARMTKAVAYAIMSEATLFNASPLWNPTNDVTKWQQAAAISKDALTQLTANGFQLANNYQNYFITTTDLSANPSDKESIFQIKKVGVGQMHYYNGIPKILANKAGDSTFTRTC